VPFSGTKQFLMIIPIANPVLAVAVGLIMGRKVKALTKTLEGAQMRVAPNNRAKQSRDLVLALIIIHVLIIGLAVYVLLGKNSVSSIGRTCWFSFLLLAVPFTFSIGLDIWLYFDKPTHVDSLR
jgi:hypothetical protein